MARMAMAAPNMAMAVEHTPSSNQPIRKISFHKLEKYQNIHNRDII
jgi:hypothetical protein